MMNGSYAYSKKREDVLGVGMRLNISPQHSHTI